jgi:NhaP-type Na+/H+ or K+/H+ antiporter
MTKRIAQMVAMVVIGVAIGGMFPPATGILDGPFYAFLVTALLAIGLYGSTHGIDLPHLRTDVRTVILAVTVGVLLKAALITAVLLAVFQNPAYLVLGIAVAQIDPLSVAALGDSSRLSRRGRGLLLAWASFDDPVTALLTIYVAALALPFQDAPAATALDLGDAGTFTVDLAGNLGLAAAAILLHRLVRGSAPRREFPVACAVLAVVFAVGIWQTWVLAIALAGLAIRPRVPGRPRAVERILDRSIDVAFLLASVLLGIVLSLGISPLPGIVLGVAAFAAQALVSLPLTRAQSRDDKVLLALAQQNGITAIILAHRRGRRPRHPRDQPALPGEQHALHPRVRNRPRIRPAVRPRARRRVDPSRPPGGRRGDQPRRAPWANA